MTNSDSDLISFPPFTHPKFVTTKIVIRATIELTTPLGEGVHLELNLNNKLILDVRHRTISLTDERGDSRRIS